MSIKNNTTSLQNLLEMVNNLPDVNEGGSGVELPRLTNEGSAADLLSGKQLIDQEGNIVTGIMTDNGAVTKTLNTSTTSYTIPKGYHNGSGKISITTESKSVTPTESAQTISPTSGKVLNSVSVAAIPSQYITTTDATASANEIMSGETAYVNGEKIIGIMANNGSATQSFDGITVTSVTIPSGYTSGGTVGLDNTISNEADEQSDLIDQIINTANSLPEANAADNNKDLYQRVEYIESAEEGTYPYIITDFYGDNESGMEVIASFPVLQDRIPMGSRLDANATRFYCVYPMSASSIYYGFNNGSSISCALETNTIYRCQTNFLNSRLVNVYDEDGIRKGGTSLSATLTTQTAPVAIFGYNHATNGTVSSKREFKLYSARCSKGHEVVREYIPCYRKSDGVIGLYEKFTEQFLTNVGDGSFSKGADIEW